MFNKERFMPALLTFSFAFLLLGCGGEESGEPAESTETETNTEDEEDTEGGGELRIAYSVQPPVLDPHNNAATATAEIMRNVFETLITMDSEYNVEPMLAESYEQSEDGTEIVFQLREGVQFHDGSEMTAEDVEASMNRWLESSGSQGQFHEDAYAEANDEYQVTIHLQEPMSTALVFMAFGGTGYPGIMPQEIAESQEESNLTEYIGTGPFTFAEWQTDQYVHLEKNENYQSRSEEANGMAGEREPLVDDIFFEFVSDSSTRVQGVQTEEYDLAHNVPYDNVEQLEAIDHLENHVYPQGNLQIVFNKREGFFTDQEARQALASSVDNEAIMVGTYTNDEYYDLNNNMVVYHQAEQWNSGEIGADIYYENDPSVMEQYLNEMNYSGEEITILTTRDYEEFYNGAVILQQQMEQMGMNVNLEVYDWPTMLELTEDETAYDIYLFGASTKAEPTSNSFMDPEYAGWTEGPEIVDEFRSLSSLEESIELYDELLEWYWEYIPVVQIGDYNRVSTAQSSVENLNNQEGFILWNVTNNTE